MQFRHKSVWWDNMTLVPRHFTSYVCMQMRYCTEESLVIFSYVHTCLYDIHEKM